MDPEESGVTALPKSPYQPSILARSSGKMRASKMLDVMTQHSEAWLSFSFNKTNLQGQYEYRLMNRGPPVSKEICSSFTVSLVDNDYHLAEGPMLFGFSCKAVEFFS